MTVTRAARLRQAADEIDAVLSQLNTASEKCGCCGLTKSASFPEAKVYDRLADTPGRLRECALHLERGERPMRREETTT